MLSSIATSRCWSALKPTNIVPWTVTVPNATARTNPSPHRRARRTRDRRGTWFRARRFPFAVEPSSASWRERRSQSTDRSAVSVHDGGSGHRGVSRSTAVLRRKQVAHRQAPVGSPTIRQPHHFVFRRDVVEPVGPLDGAAERDVPREEDVGAVARYAKEAVRRPRPDSWTSVNIASTSSSDMRAKASSLSRPSTKRAASARIVAPFRSETALSKHPRICGQQLRGRRETSSVRLETREDGASPGPRAVGRPPGRSAFRASRGGSSFVQARGRKSGRSSISLARTGSARRRNARARGSATALTTAVRLPPARARRAGRRARTSRRGGHRRCRRSASR